MTKKEYNTTFKDRDLCCRISWFDMGAGKKFREFKKEDRLYRPTVSNPDLGIVSYRKEFNMFDAGWLGSKATTHLKQKYGLQNKFFRQAYLDWFAPDYISLHLSWACGYAKILNSKDFVDTYHIVSQSKKAWKDCKGKTTLAKRKTILKNANTPERILIDKMVQNISSELLKDELQKCEKTNAGIKDCIYVARTAYRFAPELREKGMQADLEQIFSSSRTSPFDMFLIQGYKNPNLVHNAINFIEENIERNLKKISYTSIKLNMRKKEHYQWNAKDNFVIDTKNYDGVQLSFDKNITTKTIEISFDNNDIYKFVFKYKGKKVAEKKSRKVPSGWGLALDTLTFDKAITFDTVEIIPSGGDGKYSIGHFIPK